MVKMQCAVDRVEDGVAICVDEDGKVFDFPSYLFPAGTGEGSIVECVFEGNDLLSARLLNQEASQKTAENETRLHALLEKFRKSDKE